MARTKGTRRLRPHSFYAAQARSTAQVAAGVPPTRTQFELAFDYKDETTVLDYLRLTPTIERDMDTTNAFIARHGRSPPHRTHGVSMVGSDSHDPYVWFYPYRWFPRSSVTLFTFAVRYAFTEVIAWLLYDRERIQRIGATLTHVFPNTLRAAIAGRHVHIVEMLLMSPVFLELLTGEARQSALNEALQYADKDTICQLLVAHGASVDFVDDTNTPWAAIQCQVFTVGPAVKRMCCAIWRDYPEVLELGLREAGVADHSVLLAAVKNADPEDAETLVVRGFVDVDARSSNGSTALMECASKNDSQDNDKWHERRRGVVRCLLNAGADTTLRDLQGRTALHVAIENSNLSCVELLVQHTVATRGKEAVHGDTTALELACRLRDSHGDHSRRVLTTLLEHGACSRAYGELATTDRLCTVCPDLNRCPRDLKRKRGDEQAVDAV